MVELDGANCILLQDVHVEFLLGKEDLPTWVYHIAEVVLEHGYWEIFISFLVGILENLASP